MLVTVNREDTLDKALLVLKEAGILAAPVLDDGGRAVYILSVSDIVNHILKSISEDQLKMGKLTGLIQNREELAQHKIKDISFDVAEFDKPFSIRKDTPILRALQIMLDNHAHRVLAVDDDDKPLALITQSELVKIVASQLPEELLKKTVEELNLGTMKVTTIHLNKTVAEAFNIMSTQKISALPVVNSKYEGHISMTDIKFLGHKFSQLEYLAGPISELHKIQGDKRSELVKCKSTSSLSDVLKLLRDNRVHRVYLWDESTDKPVGVIAYYDILKAVLGPEIYPPPEAK